MSIITKPSILKGVPAQFTLNKSELALNPTVVADSYFSNLENWYRVSLIYKSSLGAQYEIVEFDASQTTPTGSFLVSEKARDSFEVLKIKVMDFDGGFLEIPRSSLTTADFDISFSSNPPSGPSLQSVTWDVANKTGSGTVSTDANGFISKASGGSSYNLNVLSNQSFSGDGYVEFVNNSSFVNVVFGLAEVNSPSGAFENVIIGGYNAGGGELEKVYSTSNMSNIFGGGVGSIANGDVIRFERVGTTYNIKINGSLAFSTVINNTNTLKASITIYGEGFGVNNVQITASA